MFARIPALLLLFTGPLKSRLVFEPSRAATTLLARSGQRLVVPGTCCCCSEEAAHRFESFVGHRRASSPGLSGEARLDHCGSPPTRPAELPSAEPCRTCARSNYQEARSEAHTSELQSLMRISYAVFHLQKQNLL